MEEVVIYKSFNHISTYEILNDIVGIYEYLIYYKSGKMLNVQLIILLSDKLASRKVMFGV